MWQAGRTAEALRRIAITCLWSTFVGCCKSSTDTGRDNTFATLSPSTWDELLVREVAVLDDDMSETRMTSAKSLVISLDIIKRYDLVAKNVVSEDYLHKVYPAFIKRLDDSFDEVCDWLLRIYPWHVLSYLSMFVPFITVCSLIHSIYPHWPLEIHFLLVVLIQYRVTQF